MDEHKEEGGSAGSFIDPTAEVSEEHVDVKTETLGGGLQSQLGEVNDQAKESCNGEDNMVGCSDSSVCIDDGVYDSSTGAVKNPNDGENLGEPGFDTTVRNLEAESDAKDGLGSNEKPEEDNVEKAEKTVSSTGDEETDERAKSDVKIKNGKIHDGVERAETAVSSVGNEVTDEKVKPEVEVKSDEACHGKNGAEVEESVQSAVSGETLAGNMENVTAVERDFGRTQDQVAGRTRSEDVEWKVSVEKSEDDNKDMDIDHEDTIREESEKVGVLQNEPQNPGSGTVDAKASVSAEAPNEQIQVIEKESEVIIHEEDLEPKDANPVTVSKVETACGEAERNSAVDTCATELYVTNEGEDKAGAMEIDPVGRDLSHTEEQVEKVEKVGGSTENVSGKGSADANIVQPKIQAVSISEAGQGVSNTGKDMEISKQDAEERHDNAETTDGIKSTDSANPDGVADEAVTGTVQDMGTKTRAVLIEQDNLDVNKVEEVADVDGRKGFKPGSELQGSTKSVQESKLQDSRDKSITPDVASSDTNTVEEMEIEKQVADSENPSLQARGNEVKEQPDQTHVVAEGSKEVTNSNLDDSVSSMVNDKNLEAGGEQEGKSEESLDKKIDEQEGTAHDTPDIDPNNGQDMEIDEEQVLDTKHFSEEISSDGKVNDRKRKADSLVEDLSQEARKAISMAKASPQFTKPSFKIGECIARAASHITGSPSILKGTNLTEETLSPENLLFQLHLAAVDPAKEHNFADIVTGFFLDYRNSVVPEQHSADKVCGKRNKLPNSNTVSSEAFEFEDMSDTYWTDRVIHNGGEEQQPSSEKGNYQIVPVELKPAQTQRGRRPYSRRRYSDNNNNSSPAGEKPTGYGENSPAELIMNFSEMDTIPSELNLSKMFRHFGPIREFQTEVDRESSRARVVFKKCSDAEVAYNSAGKFNIFGSKVVNYELSYTITEHFKIQPYVVSLGEEDVALCLPSQS